MIKTKLFTGVTVLEAVYDYQDFIKRNQNLEIISVNILKDNFVLLTYKMFKEDINGKFGGDKMKVKLIGENKTEVQFSNKKEGNLINQLKFLEQYQPRKAACILIFNLMVIYRQQWTILDLGFS